MSRPLWVIAGIIACCLVSVFAVLFVEDLWIDLTSNLTVAPPMHVNGRAVRELRTEWNWFGQEYATRVGFYVDTKRMAHEILERSGKETGRRVWGFDGTLESSWVGNGTDNKDEFSGIMSTAPTARLASKGQLDVLLRVLDERDAVLRIYPRADYNSGHMLATLRSRELICRSVCAGDELILSGRRGPSSSCDSGFVFFEGVLTNKFQVLARLSITYKDNVNGYVRVVFGDAREAGRGIMAGQSGIAFRSEGQPVGRLPEGVIELELLYVGGRVFLRFGRQLAATRQLDGPMSGRIGFEWSGAQIEILELMIEGDLDQDWLNSLLAS